MTDNHGRNRSAEEIEREVESARAELTRTIEKLEAEFSPDALVERGMAYFRGDGRRHVATLGSKAEANPLSVLLIGIGFAWLVFGSGRAPDRETRERRSDGDRPEPRDDRASDAYQARPTAALPTPSPEDRPGTSPSAGMGETRPDLSGGPSATSGQAGGPDPLRSPGSSRTEESRTVGSLTDEPSTTNASRPTAPGSVAGARAAAGSGIGASPVGNVAVSPDRDATNGGRNR